MTLRLQLTAPADIWTALGIAELDEEPSDILLFKDNNVIDMHLSNLVTTLVTDDVQDIESFTHEELNSTHVLYTIERLL